MTSITAARKSSYALKAVGAMPVCPTWPPTLGHFEMAFPVSTPLVPDGPYVQVCSAWLPVCIYRLHDIVDDPDEGYKALVNGYPASVHIVWPMCGGRPISQATYQELITEGSK